MLTRAPASWTVAGDMRRAASGTLATLVAAASIAACGGGSAASAIRPADPTYAGALGDRAAAGTCRDVADYAEPLTVDWRPEDRADLEVAMHAGLAVVAYDCKGIRLLPACSVEGTYGFVGVTTKEQVIRLDDADELGANLPSFAPSVRAKVAGELSRGSSLDVALLMVGQRIATRARADARELEGDCAGATHFVHGATLGAFAMQTAAKARVQSAAEIFTASVHGASSSSKDVDTKDGSIDDCRQATPDDAAPHGQCSAILRLRLRRIGPVVRQDFDQATETAIAGIARNPCPTGFAWAGAKCVSASGPAPHLCVYGDAADCSTQCDRGDAASCANLALMYDVGTRVAADPARAVQYFQKGCDGGNAVACGRLGEMAIAGRAPGIDAGRARELLRSACGGGWMAACSRLGEIARGGAAGVNVLALFDRACRGGDGDGCANLGVLVEGGATGGVPDLGKAVAYYRTGCNEESGFACAQLGSAYEAGRGVAADPAQAAQLYGKACDGGYGNACNRLSVMVFRGTGGLAKDDARAVALLEKGCKLGDRGTCVVLAMRLIGGTGVAKDEKRGKEMLREACAAGEQMACKLREGR